MPRAVHARAWYGLTDQGQVRRGEVDVERLQVFREVLDAPGAEDRRDAPRLGEQPGERELRRSMSQPPAHLRQPVDQAQVMFDARRLVSRVGAAVVIRLQGIRASDVAGQEPTP